MRLAPGREVIPIGTVSPNSVLRLGLLDELGSPVCDFRQWAEFGVRGSVGKDEVGGHQKRRLTLDTLPLSGVRTSLSSGNCQTPLLTGSTSFQLWVALPAWTRPTANRQLPERY